MAQNLESYATDGERRTTLSASTFPRPSDGRGIKGEGKWESGERDRVRCRVPQNAASPVAVRKHLPDVLKVPPISERGNVNEIIGKFGGADQLRTAVNQLQSLLYAG